MFNNSWAMNCAASLLRPSRALIPGAGMRFMLEVATPARPEWMRRAAAAIRSAGCPN
jgi:hypothetical protein